MHENALICSQLALERCRQYIAHIHALIYMTGDKADGGTLALANIHSMISQIDQELGDSQDFIRIAQSTETPPCTGRVNQNAAAKNITPLPSLYVVPKT